MNSELKNIILDIACTNPSSCMLCGKCSARCPSFNDFDIKTHEFVHLFNKGEIDKLLNSKTIYKCLTCYECEERCPRGVSPTRLINAVKEVQIRKQGENHLLADNISLLIEDDTPQQLLVSAFRKYSK